jgi:hypothetical protein
MREVDALREELAYLRLWLGMLAVADISLVGWLAAALETATPRLLSVALAGMISLGAVIVLLHRRIERRIERIRRQ